MSAYLAVVCASLELRLCVHVFVSLSSPLAHAQRLTWWCVNVCGVRLCGCRVEEQVGQYHTGLPIRGDRARA